MAKAQNLTTPITAGTLCDNFSSACRTLGSILRRPSAVAVCLHKEILAARVHRETGMTDRLELLCAELRAIDYFEWHYRRVRRPNESDELSHVR